MEDDRLSGASLFQELDGSDDILSGAIAHIVELACGVSVRPQRDHEHRRALGSKYLGPAQARDRLAPIPWIKRTEGEFPCADNEPGPDLLTVKGLEPVGLELAPVGGR